MAVVMDSCASPEPQKAITYRTAPITAKLGMSTVRLSVQALDVGESSKTAIANHLMEDRYLSSQAYEAVRFDAVRRLFRAVYVIGTSGYGVSKIGVATNPHQRLADLQVAHWEPLYLRAVVWASPEDAGKIENRALGFASEHGVRLKGEWVDLEPAEAIGLLLSSMRRSVACADTQTMLESWLPTYATMMLVNQAERAAANGNTSRMNDFSEHAQFR